MHTSLLINLVLFSACSLVTAQFSPDGIYDEPNLPQESGTLTEPDAYESDILSNIGEDYDLDSISSALLTNPTVTSAIGAISSNIVEAFPEIEASVSAFLANPSATSKVGAMFSDIAEAFSNNEATALEPPAPTSFGVYPYAYPTSGFTRPTPAYPYSPGVYPTDGSAPPTGTGTHTGFVTGGRPSAGFNGTAPTREPPVEYTGAAPSLRGSGAMGAAAMLVGAATWFFT